MSASCDWASQKRTVSSLVGGRVVKRPKQEDGRRLQQAAIQLLEQHQDLRALLGELGNSARCNTSSSQNGEQQQAAPEGIAFAFTGSLLVWELQRQATQMGVAVVVLSVKTVVERLMEITGSEEEDEEKRRELLTSSQRGHLRILMKSSKELLSQGALCPKLLWQEYRREQRQPKLEVLYHLHYYSILSLNFILESDEGVRSWLLSQLKALCGWKPPEDEEETRTVQQKVFSTVAEVLVGTGFEQSHEPAASDRNISLLCCSVLDEMLFWLLDTVDQCPTQTPAGAEQWIKIFDASLCGVSVSADALRRFFTHSLTQTLTHKPRLTVSDAITQQNEWTFVKASRLLTSLLRKLAVLFNVELLLRHLQQVLESSEVNWRHVLCFLSTLLVYNPCAQPSVRELLSRLLTSAFEGYDLENMIVAFLLARQGALEGPGIFPSYSDWFKMCFGGVSSCHATSKKSLVFLLKFLSDLVPFEPPQYLKVHILHPPYVPVKHRSLLMEYVSLAKTRLADLKESVEDMGLYEDASGADGASVPAVQDVDKAVSLFESTGRISATVMEASIFRRPYFLTRFLPALLRPRVLPVKADARMNFIDALKKSDKIPAAQYSSYLESCQRQQDGSTVCLHAADHPLDVLSAQLQTFTALTVDGSDGEMSAQLCRIAHTLSVAFSSRPEEPIGQTVIRLHEEALLSPELHVKVVDMILRCFCQCVLDASRTNPPNKQSMWASRFVSVLLGNMQLLSSLMHRLRDLFLNQGSSLSAAHILGLAVFVVHLHCSMSHSPLVVIMPPILPKAAPVGEVLSAVLVCTTRTNMLLCVRLCVAAVCYGICKGDSLPQQQQQEHIPSSLYKKLLYLIPRLLPEARAPFSPDGSVDEPQQNVNDLWSSVTDPSSAWRRTAWFLWRHTAFQQLQHIPEYQLLFREWLDNELRVQRSEDALPDSERQEYQQWACLELYLPRPEQQGGCGGDMKVLCAHLLKAVMDQQLHQQSSNTGTCLPDILSRIQELLYETEVTTLSGRRSRADVGDVLFDLVSQRCSSTVDSASLHASEELSLQHTLHTWNSLLLALPPGLFVKVKAEGGRTTLDCNKLIEHVNQHQRMACSPASSLSSPVTAHFLKGLLYASARCRCPGEELNKAWCQMSLHCPLLLISTVHWWQRLSPVLLSLWRRLCDEEPLPEQLQLISSCYHWASSLEKGLFSSPAPPAPALLLAAGLHCAWRGYRGDSEGFSAALNMLRPERSVQYRQVLVFLLSLCINDCLSTLLYPKEKTFGKAWSFCTDLLTVLVDCADWLLIFKSEGQGVYQLVTMVTPDAFTRLMPWAFYSLLLQQSRDLLRRAERCPGFLHTAVLCYIRLLQLFLDGHVPTSTTEPCEQQVEPSQILSHSKEFVLTVISQTSPDALSSSQLRELDSLCADLDPEVAAALSVHLSPHGLSPEMDFL